MDSTLCIGIDVAQDWLDLAAHPTGQPRRFKTTPDGLRSLVEHCRDTHPRLIAFEASGGYERPLADTLTQAQLPFAILNPRNVRYHARATGILAKTDRIDAAVIAQFVYRNEVQPKPAPSLPEQAVRDLVTRRNQLVEARTREIHQARQFSGASLASTERHLAYLKQEIAAVEQELRKVIAQDVSLRERAERLRSVPGVGETLAAALLGSMPELGRLNRGAVGMLAGLPRTPATAGSARGSASAGAGVRPCGRRSTCPCSRQSSTTP